MAQSYWLYVVWDAAGPAPELARVQNPGHHLEHLAREVRAVSHVELPAEAIATAAVGT